MKKRVRLRFCTSCGGVLQTRHQKKFCSISCQAALLRLPRPACLGCGKPASSPYGKFCSHRCRALVVNPTRVRKRKHPAVACAYCGAEHRNKIFCSNRCARLGAPGRERDPLLRRERKRLNNLLGVRRYQARRLGQTPEDADQEKIREIYANCPEGYEVDHIVPISKGGLHHQDNLQYLSIRDNRRKGNKLNYTPVAERLGN